MAKTITLKYPLKVGELNVTELVLQRPKTKDFIAVGENPYGTTAADAALLSSLSGLPESVIAQIDIDDLSALRFELARVWDSYFTTRPYTENPTNEERAAPQDGETEAAGNESQ